MIKYRLLTEADRKPLTDWIAADIYHKNNCTPDFWLECPENVQNFAVEAEDGTTFYVRAENAMRLYIQFPPNGGLKLARAMDEFAKTVPLHAKSYTQLIFNTMSKSLARFFVKRGAKPSPNEYVTELQELK